MWILNFILLTSILSTLTSCNSSSRKKRPIDKLQSTPLEVKEIEPKANDHERSSNYGGSGSDAETNRILFKEHLHIELTNDVKNIYTYSDTLIISDSLTIGKQFFIAFSCEQKIIDKIIAVNELKLSSSNDNAGLQFPENFSWWDKDKIVTLIPYTFRLHFTFWRYLWYDKKTRRAFYKELYL